MCDNLLLNCFALEQHVASIEMLDEVCTDMRLEWPGRRPQLSRRIPSEEPYQQSPYYGRGN